MRVDEIFTTAGITAAATSAIALVCFGKQLNGTLRDLRLFGIGRCIEVEAGRYAESDNNTHQGKSYRNQKRFFSCNHHLPPVSLSIFLIVDISPESCKMPCKANTAFCTATPISTGSQPGSGNPAIECLFYYFNYFVHIIHLFLSAGPLSTISSLTCKITN